MQTFVPFNDINSSLHVLDPKRLGKQRLESYDIYGLLTNFAHTLHSDKQKAYLVRRYANHPAVLMWKGAESALALYYNRNITEWKERGYKNTMTRIMFSGPVRYPDWWGGPIHATHRAALKHKDPEYYGQYDWPEEAKLDYYWPSKVAS